MENQELPSNEETTPKAAPGLGKFKLLIAVVVVGVVALGIVATRKAGTPTPGGAGTIVDADITLVSSDRADVGCALETAVADWQCGHVTPEKAWDGAKNEKNKLQPFYTVDRRLFLIPGLFLDPAVELRYKSELPTSKPREQLTRFVAKCRLRIQQSVPNVRVRWLESAPFGDPQPAEVATVMDCKIEG